RDLYSQSHCHTEEYPLVRGPAAILLLVVIGCLATTVALAQEETDSAARIEPGMSAAEVLDILGPPDAAQPAVFGAGGPSKSIWEYELDASAAGLSGGERLTITFENGEVREVSEHARDADPK